MNNSNEKIKIYTGTYFLGRNDLGYLKSPDFPKETIEIPNFSRNRAMHRDLVEFIIKNNKKEEKVGEITKILRRAKHGFTGILEKENGQYIIKPSNSKDDLQILINNIKDETIIGQKIYAEITDWTDFEKTGTAKGDMIEILGKPGINDTEMKALAIEKGFSNYFPPNCISEADDYVKNFENDIHNESLKRKDLRHLKVFTIDPEDAKDFDDALSLEIINDSSFRLGIHIADVSFYVKEGTALDQEARNRGTSVYLVDRTIPMLPEQLSNNLCSLKPNVDRLAMSAIFTFDQNNKIIDCWFGQTIIHSQKRFTYEEAYEVLKTKNGPMSFELDFINKLANKWREERFANGALNLETEEIKFILDEEGKPVDIKVKIRNEAHFLIEECMLLANKEIAKYMAKIKIPFIYRIHDRPVEEKILELSLYFKRLGYKIKIKNGAVVQSDLKKILTEAKTDEEKSAIMTAIIRSQAKAVYSTDNIGHFGLGFAYYTHFTSPIRRYPDLIVHRLLIENTNASHSKIHYQEIADHSSYREKDAQDAEWSSIKYKQIEYLDKNPGPHKGVITGLNKNGLFVTEHKSKADGFISLRNIKNDFYYYNEKKNIITGNKHKLTFAIGDYVNIKVVKTDLQELTIDYELIIK